MLDLCRQSELFGKAIGHQTRFKILTALFKKRESTVNELAHMLKLSQPSTSQHLKILKAGGLVISTKTGQEVHYRIDNKNVRYILNQMLKGISYVEKEWQANKK